MSADVEGLARFIHEQSGDECVHTPELWFCESWARVIAGSDWLRDLLAAERREGQRDGWDEGYEAFAAQFTQPMDSAGQRPRATNPYRDNQTGATR